MKSAHDTGPDPENVRGEIDRLLEAGRLESAQDWCTRARTAPPAGMIDRHIERLEAAIHGSRKAGETRAVRRLARRRRALEIFRCHGLDPSRLIRPAVLPAGYGGKILLVALSGGCAGGRVCLRSGDDWHREILRNTVEEMADLGFENVTVTPAGGAWVRFEGRDAIVVYGGSRDYGACEKPLAAALIGAIHPRKRCRIE